jgi:cytochrome c peroxidase
LVRIGVGTVSLSLFLAMPSCDATRDEPEANRANELSQPTDAEPILPLPLTSGVEPGRAALGKLLFNSRLMSQDSKVSCADCHLATHGLADLTPVSNIPGRVATATNTTTLYNIGLFSKLTWSGRFQNLADQNDWLIQTPKLMGTSWASVAARFAKDASWQARFKSVFSDGVSGDNARAALLDYERSLITPNAPFDRWLRGETAALSADAQRGYALFKSYGCVSCHQGMLVGANLFQRFGIFRDYFADGGSGPADLGRYAHTHDETDRHVFRVPSLRNVALTAPYFHDGSAPDLQTAVKVMARYQLGRTLEQADVALIVAFLESLTGELPGAAL